MSKKPRILYIAPFPPPLHGSSVVSLQIKNSNVINETFDGDYVNLSSSKTIDEIGRWGLLPTIKKFWRISKAIARTFRLLLAHHYDLCYCAITIGSSCFFRDALFVLMCKMFGNKVVIHQHNKGMSELLDKPVYRRLFPITYKNVKVILLSWYLYPDIERTVRKEDVMICPNGIKSSTYEFQDGPSYEKKHDVPHILFLSNLLVNKGVLVLLDSLKILKDRGIPFVCDFVGSETKEINSARFFLEREIRGLNKLVFYHGEKYGRDKELFWRNADIFTLPSLNEAFGIVNLEAMVHSLPIVASNEGGIPEIVHNNENGILIEKGDPIALADAIEKLILDPKLRHELGRAGHTLYYEKYTEEKFENRLLACLSSFIVPFMKK